jgi:hypothetical protein
VNVAGNDAKKLKAVMEKERLTWRTFADPGDIAEKWNLSATPMLYVIDARGVIRRKWVGGAPGEKAVDSILEALIKEAEADADAPSKP